MRKALSLLAVSLCAGALSALSKVAVLNPVMDEGIDRGLASPVADKVLEELLGSRRFSVVDRASRELVWEERNFQLSSGEIDRGEIRTIGQGLGADLVVVVKVKRVGSLYSVSTTMIDVETLEIAAQASMEAEAMVENLLGLASSCGRRIAAEGGAARAKTGVIPSAEDGDMGRYGAEHYGAKEEARALLKKKAFLELGGQRRILSLVGGFERSERLDLYHEYKKPLSTAFLGFLNLLPLVKAGSFVQGDVWGGLAYGLLEAGCLILYLSLGSDGEISQADTPLFTAAYFGMPIIWACSWFQPLFYALSYNKSMSRSLGVAAGTFPPADADAARVALANPGLRLTLASYRY